MRHHGTDVRTTSTHWWWGNPASRQWGVAPLKEVPDETFPAKVVLCLAGSFDDGFHHLHSPRGPMDWPSSSPIPWGFPGGGGRAEVLEPLRIHCGVVLHPARHPQRHHSTQDRVTVSPRGGPPVLRKRPSGAIIFTLIRRRADDEKTPSKVRQENPW